MSYTNLTDSLCELIAEEIRSQDSSSVSSSGLLLRDLSKLASSPSVTEEDFHATFLKALSRSGLETRLQNAVFHLLRLIKSFNTLISNTVLILSYNCRRKHASPEKWDGDKTRGRRIEPLAYIAKTQVSYIQNT